MTRVDTTRHGRPIVQPTDRGGSAPALENDALYESDSGDIAMVLTGESLITRPVSMFRESRFLDLVELLRSSDLTFTNAEMLFHDYEHPSQYAPPTDEPFAIHTEMRADPRIIDELAWLGINVVATANNHAFDFGEGGLLTNLQHLEAAGMAYAGTGRDLDEASEPAYVDTRAGRVAVIACTDSGHAEGRAGAQRGAMRGRPGALWLRPITEYLADQASFDSLRHLASEIGLRSRAAHLNTDTLFHLGGQPMGSQNPSTRFALSDGFGIRRSPDPDDLAALLEIVSVARRSADWVVVTMHNHEGGLTRDDPGDHVAAFAHAAIDAGADVYTGHGPHRDRGIEIYRGRPIIYSLGMLFDQADTVLRVGEEHYLRAGLDPRSSPADFFDLRRPHDANASIVQVRFSDRVLSELRIVPIDLGNGRSRSTRGRPVRATGQVAQRVLGDMVRMSRKYGTEVAIDGDTAVVRL